MSNGRCQLLLELFLESSLSQPGVLGGTAHIRTCWVLISLFFYQRPQRLSREGSPHANFVSFSAQINLSSPPTRKFLQKILFFKNLFFSARRADASTYTLLITTFTVHSFTILVNLSGKGSEITWILSLRAKAFLSGNTRAASASTVNRKPSRKHPLSISSRSSLSILALHFPATSCVYAAKKAFPSISSASTALHSPDSMPQASTPPS